MLQDFQEHINHTFPFLKGKKILLAISGGIDSVVLAHLLHQSKYEIVLAHCNFKLRGNESDLDQVFVNDLANQLKLPFFTISFSTNAYAQSHKLSIQVAARELRYEWFEKIRQENKLDYIITAHNKNDALETFLFNLTRGSGLDGFTGIPGINGIIVRPLLKFTRETIEEFARKNEIKWREDKSNASMKYARNKIRHTIIPVLQELNPSLLNTFDKTLENLQESRQIINDSIESLRQKIESTENGIQRFNIEKIKELSNPKAYLYELLKKYNFTEWNDILDLLNAQSGKHIFSNTHRIIKDREYLLLSDLSHFDSLRHRSATNHQRSNISDQISEVKKENIEIEEGSTDYEHDDLKLEFEIVNSNLNIETSKNVVYVDKDLLKFPLNVRKWKNGDYFYPKGMQGKKKVSKFFKDEKMSLLEKEKTWLLCNSDNTIVWITGKRLDNRFKTTTETTNTLKIKFN